MYVLQLRLTNYDTGDAIAGSFSPPKRRRAVSLRPTAATCLVADANPKTGILPLSEAQHGEDLGKLLENLQQQLVQARQQGVLDADTSIHAEQLVDKALEQAKKPAPNKKTMLDYLNTAKGIVEGAAAASGIVTTLAQVVEVVWRLL